MKIDKIRIKNYKIFRDLIVSFNDDVNILVGNNETGKSTLLEAINLCMTAQIAGRGLQYELSPYIFNTHTINQYIEGIATNANTPLPEIYIEVFLKEDFDGELAQYKGTNNSERRDCAGMYLRICFDSDFSDEYSEYIRDPKDVRTIPVEYYTWNWYSFANNTFKFSQLPSKVMLLDRSEQKTLNGTDKYITRIIDDTLEKSESAMLSLLYRKQKELLAKQGGMKKINDKLAANKAQITDKDLSISIDVSARSNWDANLTLYVDEVPFKYIGKGEQGSIKTKLALQARSEKTQIVMVEEPETNLSYANLNKLVNGLMQACETKQLIITTHSTFMMNKLGIDKVILLADQTIGKMTDISDNTKRYFQKLPGYDTLRMIIAKESILVEGRSDELIIQKAYLQLHKCLPLDNGVDVITVGGLSFKRFMEVAQMLNKKITVVTDNDGNYAEVKEKYKEYENVPNIRFCISEDNDCTTLEPQLVKSIGLEALNRIFDKKYGSEGEMAKFMQKSKADCALMIFEEGKGINMPDYILDAVQ